LFVALIRAVVNAYTFSFFWCVASAIYLLLRQDVDEKEMDEVLLDDAKAVTPAAATAREAAPVRETVVAGTKAVEEAAVDSSGGSRPPLAG
jgi:hypothetical protein